MTMQQPSNSMDIDDFEDDLQLSDDEPTRSLVIAADSNDTASMNMDENKSMNDQSPGNDNDDDLAAENGSGSASPDRKRLAYDNISAMSDVTEQANSETAQELAATVAQRASRTARPRQRSATYTGGDFVTGEDYTETMTNEQQQQNEAPLAKQRTRRTNAGRHSLSGQEGADAQSRSSKRLSLPASNGNTSPSKVANRRTAQSATTTPSKSTPKKRNAAGKTIAQTLLAQTGEQVVPAQELTESGATSLAPNLNKRLYRVAIMQKLGLAPPE